MKAFPITLAGIDCGRSSDWIVITRYHVPEGEYKNSNQVSDATLREILVARDIVKSEIKDELDKYDVFFGLIDNEPDIESSARLCEGTVLEMADQRSQQMEEFKESVVIDGGIEYPCWKIRNEKFLKSVMNCFLSEYQDGYPLVKLPNDWENYLNDNSERSPVYHFLNSPEYDPITGKWERQENHVDDLYYAFAFCEAAFYISIENQVKLQNYIAGF